MGLPNVISRLERVLVDHDLTRRLIFNEWTGALGAWLAGARRHRKYDRYRRRYDVDPTFSFQGPGITLYGPGEISLGADSYIGRHSRLQSKAGQSVRIGENTAVSHYVFAYTENRVADQDMRRARNRTADLQVRTGDVSVGAGCWIGAFTFLTEGTRIGMDTVVGAHSVVTADLPPHSIAVGTPARIVEFKSHLPADLKQSLAAEYEPVLADSLAEATLPAD